MTIRSEPPLGFVVEAMAWAVVDDQEDLATPPPYQLLQEEQERAAVKDRCELILEARPGLDRDSTEDVARFAVAVGIYTRLLSNRRPRPVQASVEPEARLVLERYDASAGCGFFLIFGNVSRSQTACAFRSALASRLRGRCTENPSWCSNRGMW